MRHAPSLLLLTLLLAACGDEKPAPAAPARTATPAAPAAPAKIESITAVPSGEHAFAPAITAEDFARHVQTLASDEYEGRAPGSLGERMTTMYLRGEFERLKLKPGDAGSYLQSVPMIETVANPDTTLSIAVNGTTQTLAMGKDVVVHTRTALPNVKVDASDLVFVGYGVDAPESSWNDYEGVDVKGKTVVVLVNDPGFLRRDPELFKGPAMTYYGRWTYKFEEAARRGAAGALIVHDTEPAAYGWDVVRNSWSGAQFDLPPSQDPEPRLQFQGWLSGEAATALFAAAGQDLAALKQAADQRGFKAVPLPAKLSMELASTTRVTSSDNVVAILPGTTKPEEAVVVMAHWDHLGRKPAEGATDEIYNGAVDNATGVAAVLELAERFATAEEKPARSIVFLLPTLEESGLLGSKFFAAHPPVPPSKIVVAINLDAMAVAGRTRNMSIVGYGQSDLEDMLAEALKPQDRVIEPEASPEKGSYFRSDHFNLAKLGIPALYAKAGLDLREGGVAAGREASEAYGKSRYHGVDDELDTGWKLDGVVEDLEALYTVTRRVAMDEATPQWREGSEFADARKASK